jgi:hypothetical protein
MFQEEERILPVQETEGKLKAKQKDFLLSEVVVVVVVMIMMTMITLCGQSFVWEKTEDLFIHQRSPRRKPVSNIAFAAVLNLLCCADIGAFHCVHAPRRRLWP